MKRLDRIFRLRHTVQHYDWGSTTALRDLLGLENRECKPMAELWMGAHPKAPSQVELPTGWVGLDLLVRENPEAILGSPARRGRTHGFPFLFKVIAAERPLSIQVHPDAAGAAEGFARENREGLPLDSPRRNYRDPNPKPELLYALKPFALLCGLRPPGRMLEMIRRLCPESLKTEADALASRPDGEGRKRFVAGILSLAAEEKREKRERVIRESLERCGRLGEPELEWVSHLARFFPEDIGVIAPAWMNVLRLEPGRAVFLPPGLLHAYISGVGIELMADSDNVIRGGLTAKHVDPQELLRTVDFTLESAREIPPEKRPGGETLYQSPQGLLGLSFIRTTAEAPFHSPQRRGVEVLLCLEGEGTIEEKTCPLQRHELRPGASFLVPAAAPSYTLAGRLLVSRAFVL
ncbi:MAG: mannose-6-phosphate isomerase, class I [Desulfobacterales bacterium]